MPSVGITGTIGSGKTKVLGYLAELGLETIQADQIGHEVLRDEETKQAVLDLLGPRVLGEDGDLDRSEIREIVFGNPELLERYNGIVHPRLLGRLKSWLEERKSVPVAVEAALIPEWGIEDWFDEVWCIHCSDEVALKRWPLDKEVYWRIRSVQFAPQRKQAKAERVIDNERSEEELRRRIHSEWERFRRNHCG